MKIEILSQAEGDLISGHRFYEKQSPGLGSYFFNSLLSDIDSLRLYGGIHPIVFGMHCTAGFRRQSSTARMLTMPPSTR